MSGISASFAESIRSLGLAENPRRPASHGAAFSRAADRRHRLHSTNIASAPATAISPSAGKWGASPAHLALGQGFSNPYGDSTGPTAWEPPLYPYWMAGVFKIFGVYSAASAWVLLIFNSLFNALTCIPIFFIANWVIDERAAWWSAWIWALLPYEMYWADSLALGHDLLPVRAGLHFSSLARTRILPGWKGWVLYGFLWGLIALSNPSILSFLPFSGLWIWYRRSKHGFASFGRVVVASLVFLRRA